MGYSRVTMKPRGYAVYSPRMGRMTHRERLTWPVWIHLALGTAVGLSLYGGIDLLAVSWQGWIPLAMAGLLGFIWWRIRVLVVETGPDGIAFGFGRPSRCVIRDRIKSAEAVDYSVSRYMGWGSRIGWKPRERAYSIMGYARGLQISFLDEQDREWNVFLSCIDPEAGVRALRT